MKINRGYEALNPSFIFPAIVAVAHQCPELAEPPYVANKLEPLNSYVMQGCLDWLYAQGVLEGGSGELVVAPDWHWAMDNLDELYKVVSQYGMLAQSVSTSISDPSILLDDVPSAEDMGLSTPDMAVAWRDALLPPAIALLFERLHRGDNCRLVRHTLLEGGTIDIDHEFGMDEKPDYLMSLFDALEQAGLVVDTDAHLLRLNEEGRRVLQLGGYAELMLSYYEAVMHLSDLDTGKMSYGLNGDVNRSGPLNARASNGILGLRVAPSILEMMSHDRLVTSKLDDQGGFVLDFGCGGGELTRALSDSPKVSKAFGMDVNPVAIDEARELSVREGYGVEELEFLQGSITDKDFFEAFLNKLPTNSLPVCTINFILHDVGTQHAKTFLNHYREVFGSTPIIITESFRVPDQVMLDHPEQQASSFKFMHDISGQHLFYKEEFEDLLGDSGFEIHRETSHSSINWVQQQQRFTTISTYIVMPK